MTTSELAARPNLTIQTSLHALSSEPETAFQPNSPPKFPFESTSDPRSETSKPFLVTGGGGRWFSPLSIWPHQLIFDEQYLLAARERFREDLPYAASELLENADGSLTGPRTACGKFAREFERELDPTTRDLWKSVTSGHFTELRVVDVQPLDKLLTRRVCANLRRLQLVVPGEFPFRSGGPSMAATLGYPAGPLFPNLVNFRFEFSQRYVLVAASLGDDLLAFLGNCPRLAYAHFDYGHGGSEGTIKFSTHDLVPLDNLRLFTHESPVETMPTGLLKRLSLPPDCEIKLQVTAVSGSKKEATPSTWSEPVPGLEERLLEQRDGWFKIICEGCLDVLDRHF